MGITGHPKKHWPCSELATVTNSYRLLQFPKCFHQPNFLKALCPFYRLGNGDTGAEKRETVRPRQTLSEKWNCRVTRGLGTPSWSPCAQGCTGFSWFWDVSLFSAHPPLHAFIEDNVVTVPHPDRHTSGTQQISMTYGSQLRVVPEFLLQVMTTVCVCMFCCCCCCCLALFFN